MQNQNSNSSNQSSGSCLLPALIMISIGLALLLGAAGGAMLDDPRAQTQTTTYPKRSDDIPAPATLNDVPSAQTFAVDPCDYPTAPVPNYEVGVGGLLPPCWSVWTREQQNAFLRSH